MKREQSMIQENRIKILLYKPIDGHEWWWSKLVKIITDSDYYHAVLWIDGWRYESVAYFTSSNKWISGIRKYRAEPNGDIFVFKEALTDKEIDAIKKYAVAEIGEPYNFSKLLAFWFIYPLRWFWRLIGWVPFSWEVYGRICSVYVDSCIMAGGIDLLPNNLEGYSSPGDIANSKLLQKE